MMTNFGNWILTYSYLLFSFKLFLEEQAKESVKREKESKLLTKIVNLEMEIQRLKTLKKIMGPDFHDTLIGEQLQQLKNDFRESFSLYLQL